jgi:predicted ATPase
LQPIVVTHPTNLPDEPTSFIGREREIDELRTLLQQPTVRLLTLTGPGGVGKTRLALQVASALLPEFRDGVFFVSLASLADPALVPSALAAVLEIKEEQGKSLLQRLAEQLQEKHLLLVLDNFEHLLMAASNVAKLLDACRELRILVTSRIPLHLSRENEYSVPPLAVPDPNHLPDPGTLSQYEAVALFVQRAGAVKSGFAHTNENAPAVAEICYRLDGLPLALELAAARIRLFSPGALLARLQSSLQLLTGGPQDQPARQQTLRNTIDWSYNLLSPDDQALLTRLSVFAGGCTLEAAEAVCNLDGELDLLDGMTSLVEQSLVRLQGEKEQRFIMLETVREYAYEKLVEGGERNQVREAHAAQYLNLAQEAESGTTGPNQGMWFARLEAEHDNLRAALSWFLDRRQIEEELRLAAALIRFWVVRGHWSEGVRWLDAGLTLDDGVAGKIRARALQSLGDLIGGQGEHERAVLLLEEALSLFRILGDKESNASALITLGFVVYSKGDVTQAIQCVEEGLAFFRQVGDRQRLIEALIWLGIIADDGGDFGVAEAHWREALALAREMGDTTSVANSLNGLGLTLMEQGNLGEAKAILEESLSLSRELELNNHLPYALDTLACVESEQGDNERAATLFAEALSVSQQLGDKRTLLFVLGHMAELAVTQGNIARAARLGGAEAAGRDASRIPIVPVEREHRERALDRARQELGEDAFRRAWERGRAMSLAEAVACALGEIP